MLLGAAAWNSIGKRMGMFVYVADEITGPYKTPTNYALMAYEQGWPQLTEASIPTYFATFFPTPNLHRFFVVRTTIFPAFIGVSSAINLALSTCFILSLQT